MRFVSETALAFPPSELTFYREQPDAEVRLGVSFIGLHGPSGVMPQAYSELIQARIREKDTSLASFFDLFLHRSASFFMRVTKPPAFTLKTKRSPAPSAGARR